MISVIIPARNEPYLTPTITDVLGKAGGEVEVVLVQDGAPPEGQSPIPSVLREHPKVHIIEWTEPRGMRAAINAGVAAASGRYVMKLDGHCMMAPGWDGTLLKTFETYSDDTVVIPRRKRLDPDLWALCDTHKLDVDYERLGYPRDGEDGIRGQRWDERAIARRDVMIDETPTMQGSCYLLSKEYWDWLELLDESRWGSFRLEAQEISFKVWLSGGRILVNKNTWYAHWHKKRRGFSLDPIDQQKALDYSRQWLTGFLWGKQIFHLQWLIDRFKMPGWPEGGW